MESSEVCSCVVADWCERRQTIIPSVHFTKCQAGKVAHIDRVYEGLKSPSPNVRPRVGAATTSTAGTLLHVALEDSGHRGTMTTRCKNYLNQLNQPQRHDVEAITDRLMDELKYESVKNVKRPRQGPKGRERIAELVLQAIRDDAAANPRPAKPAELPDVSDLGTRLKAAIESAGDFTMSCGHCLSYLRSLNKSTHHNVDKILDGLLVNGELPQSIRDRVGGIKAQREWLRVIVESVIHAE